MGEGAAAPRPQAVLFACGLNTVRSPMAAGLLKQMLGGALYVGSAGVRKGELDPFAVAAMEEHGIYISAHRPMTFEELEDWEGLNFDLIVTLSPEAHHGAHGRRRGRVLADRRSDRDRRQPRAAPRRLPCRARSLDGAHQDAVRPAAGRQ